MNNKTVLEALVFCGMGLFMGLGMYLAFWLLTALGKILGG
jgi:hypothetical protein